MRWYAILGTWANDGDHLSIWSLIGDDDDVGVCVYVGMRMLCGMTTHVQVCARARMWSKATALG